jgi:serine/threonine protein kinase
VIFVHTNDIHNLWGLGFPLLGRGDVALVCYQLQAALDASREELAEAKRNTQLVPSSCRQVPWSKISKIDKIHDFVGEGRDCTGVYKCFVDVAGHTDAHFVIKVFPEELVRPPLREAKGILYSDSAVVQAMFITTGRPWGIVYPFMNKNSLRVFYKESANGNTKEWQCFMRNATAMGLKLTLGMTAIHECGLVHRDLHTGNVMVNKDLQGNFTVAISDLGRMVINNAKMHKGKKPNEQEAQEYLNKYKQHPYEYGIRVGHYTQKADIYSLCRILSDNFIKINHSSPETLKMSKDLVDLLKKKGLAQNPADRPTLAKLVEDLRSLIAVRECICIYVDMQTFDMHAFHVNLYIYGLL